MLLGGSGRRRGCRVNVLLIKVQLLERSECRGCENKTHLLLAVVENTNHNINQMVN